MALWISIAVSLAIHLFLSQWVQFVPSVAPKKQVEKAIDVMPMTEDSRQVVQTRSIEDQDTKEKARFLSDVRNRPKTAMQAARRGSFRESTLDSEIRENDRALKDALWSDLVESSGVSPFAVDKEIAKGPETVLDTDPVLYASFVSRISDKIYAPWVSLAREAIDGRQRHGHQVENNIYTTKLGVVLNRNGEITAIETIKSSGMEELDEAPRRAFWDLAIIPNPPKRMFGDKEVLRFVYEFQFEWGTSSFFIKPWSI